MRAAAQLPSQHLPLLPLLLGEKEDAQSSSSASEFGGPVDGRWKNAAVPAGLHFINEMMVLY